MAGNINTCKQVTTREFINVCCFMEDLPTVNRMFQHDLNKFGPGVDAPMWEKERFYEEWLNRPFSNEEWNRAKARDTRPSYVPKDFYGFNTQPQRFTRLA